MSVHENTAVCTSCVVLVSFREGLCWFSAFCRVRTRMLCVCIEMMEQLEVWQYSGTTSNDFRSLGWWGTGKCPRYHNCVNSLCSVSDCQAAGALGAVPGSSSVAGLVGESSPISPTQWATLQHPHYPHSSKGSPERSVTSHKRLYRLVCQSISRGPLYLSASSSVMKRPSAGRVSRLPAAGISSSSHQDFN